VTAARRMVIIISPATAFYLNEQLDGQSEANYDTVFASGLVLSTDSICISWFSLGGSKI